MPPLFQARPTRSASAVAAWILAPFLAMSSGFAAEEQTLALWKNQEINFAYSSSTSVYSCGALRSRVKSVLRAVGADENLEVSVSGCEEFLFPSDIRSNVRSPFDRSRRFARTASQFASVRIRLRSPTPVTPEALAELEKSRPYLELLGRVTGSNAAVQEAASQFPAQRQRVSLSSRTLRLEPEECELIEQIIREVFPKLDVRVVEKSISCFPRQVSLLKPRVEVEALIRTPPTEAGAQQPPSEPQPAEPQESSSAPAAVPSP
jgi:hypothetical protein